MSVSARYLHRSLEPTLRRAARQFPAVVLTGPRQSGKSTLLAALFGKSREIVSLEAPDVLLAAAEDPRRFLEAHPPPVVFDEVQHAPGLLRYVKERIDRHRSRAGQYVLTGSQDLLLLEQVTESLAGRAAVLRLPPLSHREAVGQPQRPLGFTGPRRSRPRPGADFSALWAGILRGGYPELVADPGRDIALWHSSYLQTYLERDVRSLRRIGDLTSFRSFLRALAARNAQILDLSGLARDLGTAVNTVKAWLSLLEATHQVTILRPWFANIGKRLVKSPKVYFTDTGTLCHLVGLRDPGHAAGGPMAGSLFETAVLAEMSRVFLGRGEEPRIYFWRTAAGAEVDFIVDTGRTLVPVEAKLSATPRPAMAEDIRRFRRDVGERVGPGFVIHPGDVVLPLGGEETALPFSRL